jgi:hypothetical protein
MQAQVVLVGVLGTARGGRHTSRSRLKPPLLILMEDQAGRRYQIPGELQTPELQILLRNLDNGDSLITFSGNFPDSASQVAQGGYPDTQFLG